MKPNSRSCLEGCTQDPLVVSSLFPTIILRWCDRYTTMPAASTDLNHWLVGGCLKCSQGFTNGWLVDKHIFQRRWNHQPVEQTLQRATINWIQLVGVRALSRLRSACRSFSWWVEGSVDIMGWWWVKTTKQAILLLRCVWARKCGKKYAKQCQKAALWWLLSGKFSWKWKIHYLQLVYLLKLAIFSFQVSFPEGKCLILDID